MSKTISNTALLCYRSTLCRFEGSFLEAMFSGRHTVSKDKEGRTFIDRNPTHFAAILDFLRDPIAGKLFPVSRCVSRLTQLCSLLQGLSYRVP